MKHFFLKIGYVWACISIILLAVIFSVVIIFLVYKLSGGEMTRMSLIGSIVTPAVITTLIVPVFMRVLFDLDKAEKRYKELAAIDDLTGIKNRRAFLESVERELAIAERYRIEFALVLFDINGFKKINDHFGHIVGDQVLQEVAQTCQKEIRKSDVIARMGGDEFVILVTQSEKLDINKYMDRLSHVISEIEVNKENPAVRISVSMGAQRYTPDINTFEEIYSRADREMYLSKNS